MKKEEKKPLFKHYLVCTKCRFTFQIEHPENNNTKIGLEKMRCPLCQKPVMLNPAMFAISGKPSMEHQSRMNIEASREAISQANKQKQIDRETGEGEEVSITSTQKGSSGKTERIPKKVIESIEEKIKEEPALNE